MLARKDVLAGLMFMAVAAFGLWLSRDYPIGTAFRMGTGYVPRLLCWILLGLGAIVFLQGLRDGASRAHGCGRRRLRRGGRSFSSPRAWWFSGSRSSGSGSSFRFCCWSGSARSRRARLRPLETVAAALVLIVLSWAIFILGLGLTIPVWPEW